MTMKPNGTKEFWTSDMVLAASLSALGYPVNKSEMLTEGRDRGKVVFLFENSPSLQADVVAFDGGELAFEPRRFYAAYNGVRDLVIALKRQSESRGGR